MRPEVLLTFSCLVSVPTAASAEQLIESGQEVFCHGVFDTPGGSRLHLVSFQLNCQRWRFRQHRPTETVEVST